jgi:hypothetical protein
MRRSAHLVRPQFWFVLFWVTFPIAFEHAAIHFVHDLVLHFDLLSIFIVEGLVGMLVGSFVGLVEVNIAYALVAEDRQRTAPAPAA